MEASKNDTDLTNADCLLLISSMLSEIGLHEDLTGSPLSLLAAITPNTTLEALRALRSIAALCELPLEKKTLQ